MRAVAAKAVQETMGNEDVVWHNRALFNAGLELYRRRLDKEYSIQDCISMIVMQNMGIKEILSSDRHFVQEGFRILME